MMKKQFFAIAVATLVVFMTLCQAQAEVKIGVLAKDGPLKAMNKWGATGEYLTAQIGEPVSIIPLDFDEIYPAVSSSKVDFFLTNSSMFMTAKVKFGATPVATMINSRQGSALSSFGGVIFTKSNNNAINSLNDLKGKKLGAVAMTSFGGWQMSQKELMDSRIDPFHDLAALRFMDKHDAVVKAVLNNLVDAGTVRTDTLERMAAAGTISMGDFKIIARKSHYDFPFVCSTALYPEWPLAKTASTNYMLANRVVTALKLLTTDDTAAKNAKIIGWTDPLDYSGVEDLQRELKVGGFR